MNTIELDKKLKTIDFFRDDVHPEYIPFIGEDYLKYKILHIGESHYLPNYPSWKAGEKDFNGNPIIPNKITLKDFEGWWDGTYSETLRNEKGWFNTKQVVIDYMSGYRDKAHGIFTNTLKSFCKVVTPNESFESISTENSKKYNYFAYMNFYQQPSIYYGRNFTKSLYEAGNYINWDDKIIDKKWYEIFDKSVEIVEKVIEVLEPKCIVVTSREIYKYYRDYGSVNEHGERQAGKLFDNDNMIWLDHPSCAWWNKERKEIGTSSKSWFEESLKRIYKV